MKKPAKKPAPITLNITAKQFKDACARPLEGSLQALKDPMVRQMLTEMGGNPAELRKRINSDLKGLKKLKIKV